MKIFTFRRKYMGIDRSTVKSSVKKTFKEMSKRELIIMGIIIVLIFTDVFIIKDYLITKDPIKRIVYGYEKLNKTYALKTKSVLSVDFSDYFYRPETSMVVDLMEKTEIIVNSKVNRRENKYWKKIELKADKHSLADMTLYSDKEIIGVHIPLLIQKWVYLKPDELGNLLNELTGGRITKFDIQIYRALSDFSGIGNLEEVKKDYLEFLSKNLNKYAEEGRKKVNVKVVNEEKESILKCEEVIVKMNKTEILEFYEKLMNKVREDDRIKEVIKLRLYQFINKAKRNGNMKDIDEKWMEENFDNVYNKIIKGINELKIALQEGPNLSFMYRFRFDSKHVLRNIVYEMTMNYDDADKLTKADIKIINNFIVNSINQRIEIDKPNVSMGYNYSQNPEQISQEISRAFKFDLIKNLMANDKLLELFDTISP
jgi:hypothetical protein